MMRWLGCRVVSSWAGLVMLGAVSAMVGCTSAAARDARTERMIAASLVKIDVTANPPDYQSPWQRAGVTTGSGSGVIVSGQRILTAAHVVADAVTVSVQRAGGTRRFDAEVAFVGHACDLAMLTVEDERFFEGARALELGELPRLRDRVDVYGFPEGGERIAVTSGIVSRVESGAYVHSDETLLLVQIDAAINSGNSGGPVVAGARVVGIAAETLEDAENIGYMIPAPIVRHFLDDVKDGDFEGFPVLGAEIQTLDNLAHMEMLLGPGSGDADGVLVRRINYGSPAWGVLEPGDVLTHVDGVAISSDGTVRLRGDERVGFDHLISSKQAGEHVRLRLWRARQPVQREVTLRPYQPLVPGPRYDVMPTYYFFGGLVFQPLTSHYLNLFGSWPADLANHAVYNNVVREDRRQVLVVSHVLHAPLTEGYEGLQDYVVAAVNGTLPRDMRHLVELLEGESGWVDIELEGNYHIAMDRGAERFEHSSTMVRYDIPRDRSVDLRPQ